MIKANTCPYCGGPYTLASACYGRRTDTPGENCCPEMSLHARLVDAAAREPVREDEEVYGRQG